MLDARYRTRLGTVPPAALIDTCHASLRDSRATSWSAAAARSTLIEALERAVANSSRRPQRIATRIPAAISEPAMVINFLCRRAKRRVACQTAAARDAISDSLV